MIFKTTDEQVVQLAAIATRMKTAGLTDHFIAQSLEIGRLDQGVFDLMALWDEATTVEDRDETVADIQESIDDFEDRHGGDSTKKPYVRFKDFDDITSRIREHKQKLRILIENHGGVSEVARKSGIPQPSLSRLLNSTSMPRRSTLHRIANALNLSEADVVTEWTR